ncbi:DUF421 domain-containing protein [Melghirimyces algeriensis]|uniref:Uncharacterized membrane protein YcaP, DUF421 family n=1 Tax=Melghirimyces algeriensis TaxID=910412 RepID=A0A521BCT3_9BACL|nr:DUF421 domain-containing protein [Melghirimyces algeriensis]SMO44906.1 Uncharacterized membrane protein YcaP, DUF421 family [Melghirimyces algeriensis]
MEVLITLGRTLFSFLVLLVMTRWMGKKQMSQLTFFHYITGITIGSLAAIVSLDPGISLPRGAASLIGWSALTVIIGYLALKSPKARIAVDGEPTIVIRDGKILEKAMQGLRLSMDDLNMLLREKNIYSVNDVDQAVLEPNGKLSVIKKPEKQSVTKQDMNVMTVKPLYMPTEIITDGKVIQRNLKELNLTPEWLNAQLQQSGTRIEDIFYAEIQNDGTLYIDKRGDQTPNLAH